MSVRCDEHVACGADENERAAVRAQRGGPIEMLRINGRPQIYGRAPGVILIMERDI